MSFLIPIARGFLKEFNEVKRGYVYVQTNPDSLKSMLYCHRVSQEQAFLYDWGKVADFYANHFGVFFYSEGFVYAQVEKDFLDAIGRKSKNPNFTKDLIKIIKKSVEDFKKIKKEPSRLIFYLPLPDDHSFIVVPIVENLSIPVGKFFVKTIPI